MKTAAWIIAVVLTAIGIAIFANKIPIQKTVSEKTPTPQIRPAAGPISNGKITLLPISETSTTLNSQETTAQDDIEALDLILSMFRKSNGENPVGANDEITAALLGNNSKRLAFLPAKGSFLSSDGQMIDRWGTPYFFHALTGKEMDIFSAGPDREHHTTDDITSD